MNKYNPHIWRKFNDAHRAYWKAINTNNLRRIRYWMKVVNKFSYLYSKNIL